MSTAIVPYSEIEKMATTLTRSGLFGIKNSEQALALMLVAQAEGLHPATVAVDYDFIQGKPTKKPVAMLRDFIKGGGKVEWHQLDDTVAEATFSHGQGGRARVRWDMEKAARAGLSTKDMWKKFPAAMLRSRCVSEGLRAVFPAATGGLYTPEEVADFGPSPASANTVNPRGDVTPMDPERRQQYADAVAPMLDRDQTAMPRHEAAQLCLAVRALWDELDQDEQIQVNDLFNTKQKNRLKKIYAVPVEKLEEAARVIDVQTEGVAA